MTNHIKSIAILSDVPRIFNHISQLFPSLEVNNLTKGSPDILKQLQSVDVIVADFDKIAEYIYLLKETKWIQGTWAGVEPVMKQYEKKKVPPCFPIARFSGLKFGTMMSEYVVAHVTSFERDFKKTFAHQNEKLWSTEGKIKSYRVIGDMKVGILGGGQIGLHIASTLKILGAAFIKCLVTSIPKIKSPFIDEYCVSSQLNELLETSDLVVNVLPHSASTVSLLNKVNLEKCRGSLFVNIGRGSVINEQDLMEALDKKYLRGAILDVFENEPLPKTSRLWEMPQVTITPHVAGVTRAQDVASVFKSNVDLWEQNQTLSNTIDFSKGY